METTETVSNKTNIRALLPTKIEALIPEHYYITKAILNSVHELQDCIAQAVALSALASNQVVNLTYDMQCNTWRLLTKVMDKIKVHGDTLELTILDELEKYIN